VIIVLQCPRCGEIWRHDTPPEREFVSAYCLCDAASDARHSTTRTGVRMIVLETASAEPAGAGA